MKPIPHDAAVGDENETVPIYRLRIALKDTTPAVWRRIEVPAAYTFWDLHVAIQDAMGWLDYHLHEFVVKQPNGTNVSIGFPDDDMGDGDVLPGWDVPLADHFGHAQKKLKYTYDFGDRWTHTISVEGTAGGHARPRCIAGKHAAPPEDCGGASGFEELKEVLSGPKNDRYREMRSWLKDRHARCYWPFDPLQFDCSQVVFADPAARLRQALEG